MTAKNPIHQNYDSLCDILYVDIGQPCHGYSEEIADDIYLRLDSESNTPVGFTILSYNKKPKELLKKVLPFNIDWGYIDRTIKH